ncbi:bifunctional folylpolyglutamate synthase/dihydrofolate synthase, partial [Elusimicrobiota bacterium]
LIEVLEELGSPHKKIPVISVAGTNGKGSVSAVIQKIISKYGKKAGLYTSPHIFSMRERININGRLITHSELKVYLKAVNEAQKKTGTELTYFEKITAIAIKYFFDQECDLCVMETGLGGRLDATNVCERKMASVITPISLEHTEYLGNTVEEIAREKAGIIRSNSIVIDSSGVDVIRKTGLDAGCRVYTSGSDYHIDKISPLEDGRYSFNYESEKGKLDNMVTGLRGIHQCYNSAAAVTAVTALGYNDPEITRKGVEEAYLKGRLEVFELAEKKTFVVDAAHNPAGIQTVSDHIVRWMPEKSDLYVIIGVYKDKNIEEIAKIIYPLAKKIFSIALNNPRALKVDKLASYFNGKGEVMEDFSSAYRNAAAQMKKEDWILSCGSFSVVQQALGAMNNS